mgnify:CR=1 FL=1
MLKRTALIDDIDFAIENQFNELIIDTSKDEKSIKFFINQNY